MAKVLISESNLTAIANAIRAKTGSVSTITPNQMATKIGDIETEIYYTSDGRSYPENMVFPSTVTSISSSACKDFTHLKSVDMSDMSSGLSTYCFNNCVNLKTAILPSGFSYAIPQDCFNNCEKLEAITLPVGITSIGARGFRCCSSLEEVALPEGISFITTYVFQNCTGLTDLTLPLSITSIGGNAFSGCTALKHITLADGFLATINLTASTEFTADDIIAMFNKLGEVPEGETRVMSLGSTNLAKLTNAQKLVATSRGWTLA